jgi:hypothetical protein
MNFLNFPDELIRLIVLTCDYKSISILNRVCKFIYDMNLEKLLMEKSTLNTDDTITYHTIPHSVVSHIDDIFEYYISNILMINGLKYLLNNYINFKNNDIIVFKRDISVLNRECIGITGETGPRGYINTNNNSDKRRKRRGEKREYKELRGFRGDQTKNNKNIRYNNNNNVRCKNAKNSKNVKNVKNVKNDNNNNVNNFNNNKPVYGTYKIYENFLKFEMHKF